MNLEFLLLIFDYFKTIKRRSIIFDFIIPFSIGVFVFINLKTLNNTELCTDFRNNSLPLLGVLIGFSITIITILTTGHSRNIEEIKKIKTGIKISNTNISLFRLLLINFIYSVIIEIFVVIALLIYPFVIDYITISSTIKYIGFSAVVITVTHILLLTIRNMTSFYFIISKNT